MSADLQGHGPAWFARKIGMSESWVRSNLRRFQHNKVGGRIRFTELDVEAFWERFRVQPGGGVEPIKPDPEDGPIKLQTTKRAQSRRKP